MVRAIVLIGVMLLVATGSSVAQSPPQFILDWSPGMTGCIDVAIGLDGSVYVAGWVSNNVKVFTSEGVLINEWGTPGSGPGQFDGAAGLAVDAAGNVYVGDMDNHRVQKFTSDGTFVTEWGTFGTGAGQFIRVHDVCVGPAGFVYVADFQGARVQKFTSDGTYVTEWGSSGAGDGQFMQPASIAVDSEGYVYVGEDSGHRVQKFTSDGTFVLKWGEWGTGDGQFDRPIGLCVDQNDNVIVSDWGNNRIQMFTGSGDFILKWGSYGGDPGQFRNPFGLEMNLNNGFLYITTWADNTVQKYGSGSVPVFFSYFEAKPSGMAVDVVWDLSGDQPLDRFTLYRHHGATKKLPIASGGAETTGSYTDTSVEPNTTYHYELVIRAANGDQYSSRIATASTGPLAAKLDQNFPNPFNPRTTIEYTVNERTVVAMEIFDASGALVRRLEEGARSPGTYRVEWNGLDESGRAVASGAYFYRLSGVDRVGGRKMMLLK